MFHREVPTVQVHDRFVKNGDPPGRVWVVIRVWKTVDNLMHARMIGESRSGETRIISVSALTDPHFYKQANRPI